MTDEPKAEATMADKYLDERAREAHRETAAMHSAFCILQPLEHAAQKRALRWLAEALENVEVPF